MNRKNKHAFTLAEVLVTLSILGVVAAISIPNIIQQYKKQLTISKLKIAYSVLENAAQNIAINSGCYNQTLKCTGLLDMADKDTTGDPTELHKKFMQLSGIKGEISNSSRKYLQHQYCAYQCSTGESYVIFNIISTKNDIGYSVRYGYYDGLNERQSLRISVITDTKNNAKLVMGKNVFDFIMYDNFTVEPGVLVSEWSSSYVPMSKVNDTIIEKACNPKTKYGSSGSDTGCAAKIVKDGWKITYW